MLEIYIQGLGDGVHAVDATCRAEDLPEMCPEFFGDVAVCGQMRIIGKRYSLNLTAKCKALLTCDVSLEEYEEEISAEFSLVYLADAELYNMMDKDDMPAETSSGERVIFPEDKTIDISEDVREELCVNLPMKHVAPQYRDKDFFELYPELKPKETVSDFADGDERWAKLKNFKLK
ncbi:MAG: DUF177 domain-containing protein [Candidatus Kapabacteria bacterium]|nr:DUF177 domain-containing protein [Candidatus Kapabacteria bacterium]